MTTTEPATTDTSPEVPERSETADKTDTAAEAPKPPGKLQQVKAWVSEEIKHRPRPMTERPPSGTEMIQHAKHGAWTLDGEDSHRRTLHGLYARWIAIPVIAASSFLAYMIYPPERFSAALAAFVLIVGGVLLWLFL